MEGGQAHRGLLGLGASKLDQREEDIGRERQTHERGGWKKVESLLLGGVSAVPWSQMDRLRQEEGQDQRAS